MTTIAELMELAEIPVLEGYVVPKLRPRYDLRARKRKATSKAVGADLEDIEEEEGERKLLLERIFSSNQPKDGSRPSEEPEKEKQQPPLDPHQPIAGVNTVYAPRVVPPPSHLQMDAATRARVFGRKIARPQGAHIVHCHRCDAPMRICIRKLKYIDHIKEYPSFRCTRKGCQTFKSMRIVDEQTLTRVIRTKRTPTKRNPKKGEKRAPDEDGADTAEEPNNTAPGDVPNPYVSVRKPTKAAAPTSVSSEPCPLLAPIRPPAMRSLGSVVGSSGSAGPNVPAPVIPPLNHPMYSSMMTTRSRTMGSAPLQQMLTPGRAAASACLLSTPHRRPISASLAPLAATPVSSSSMTSSELLPAPDGLSKPAFHYGSALPPRRRSRYDTCTQEQKEAVAALLRKYDEELEREATGGYYSTIGGGGWADRGGASEGPEKEQSWMGEGRGREDATGLSSIFDRPNEAPSSPPSAESAAAIYQELVKATGAANTVSPPPCPPPPVTTQPLVLPVSTQSTPICITLSPTPSPTPQPRPPATADNGPVAPTTPAKKEEEEDKEPAAPLPLPSVRHILRPMESPGPLSAAAYSQQVMQQQLSPLDIRSFQFPRMQQHVQPLQQQLLQTAPVPPRVLSPAEMLALQQISSAARTLAAINVMTRTATQFALGNPLLSGYGAQQSLQQLQAQFSPIGGLQQQQQFLQQFSPSLLPAQWNFFGEDDDKEQPRDSPTSYVGLNADVSGHFDNNSVMILEEDDSGIADQTNRDDTQSERYDEYDSHEYDAEFAMELRQHNM